MDSTPASLLERLRLPVLGDAWERFVEIYSPVIFAWGRRMGLQEADASDLTQEVFAILVRKLPEFHYDGQRSFRAWLKTITLNKFREQQRPRELPLAHVSAENVAESAESLAFWEVEYRRHVVGRALQIMQADFEPTTWQACWQVVAERRPPAEVVAQLQLTVGAVYAARFRVLARLRRELAGMLD